MRRTLTIQLDIIVSDGQENHLEILLTEYAQREIAPGVHHTMPVLRPSLAGTLQSAMTEYLLQHGMKSVVNIK